jgi:transcriptional regulator with XRE-family HTH domain
MDIDAQLNYVIGQIKKARVQKGVSQIELSLSSGLSQSFLANLEKGKKQPSVFTIIKIADALEMNVQDFFPRTSRQETRQEVKEKIIALLDAL